MASSSDRLDAFDSAIRSLINPRDRLRTDGDPVPVTDDAPHAVVVGAGFGGLAAAVRLGARGYRVTVLDRLEQPGGRARVFRDGGFTFDAGPTVITAPFLLEELWRLAGAKLEDDVELREVAPFYRIRFHDGSTFDYVGDEAQMRAQIAALRPEDVEGYERFLEHSERIFDVGFTMLGHVPFDSVMDMARILPAMLQLESLRTVWQLVSKYVKSPKLRQVLSFHTLLVGGNPFSTSSIYALVAFLERDMKVWYAMGGTFTVVQGLVRLIEERLGGRVRLGEEVRQILVEGGRARGVELASGERVEADVVVSNADAAWTYRHLVEERLRPSWSDRRVERMRFSMSLFVWYFGTDRVYVREGGDINTPTFFRYDGPTFTALVSTERLGTRSCTYGRAPDAPYQLISMRAHVTTDGALYALMPCWGWSRIGRFVADDHFDDGSGRPFRRSRIGDFEMMRSAMFEHHLLCLDTYEATGEPPALPPERDDVRAPARVSEFEPAELAGCIEVAVGSQRQGCWRGWPDDPTNARVGFYVLSESIPLGDTPIFRYDGPTYTARVLGSYNLPPDCTYGHLDDIRFGIMTMRTHVMDDGSLYGLSPCWGWTRLGRFVGAGFEDDRGRWMRRADPDDAEVLSQPTNPVFFWCLPTYEADAPMPPIPSER